MKALLATGTATIALGIGGCVYTTHNPGSDMVVATLANIDWVAGSCLLALGITLAMRRYNKQPRAGGSPDDHD